MSDFELSFNKFREWQREAHPNTSAKEAWNHQQQKIDAIIGLIDKYQYSSGERILKEVKELLK